MTMRKLLLIAFFLLSACSFPVGSDRLVTGFIQSSKTDDNDNPVDGFIWDGKTEYRIGDNKKKDELLELIDRKVAIRGRLFKDWGGKMEVEVDSYQVLD